MRLHRQHYYRWLTRPITAAELRQAYRANALFDAHRDDPEFGDRPWPTDPAWRENRVGSHRVAPVLTRDLVERVR